MDPALWGAVTAATWGGGDFISRFTGRAMGPAVALFGMLIISGAVLTLFVWREIGDIAWDPTGGPLVLLTGVGITAATLLLYWGMARGPVTVVAPIASSYPAFALALVFVLGARPSVLQWSAMAVVVAGVAVVARASGGPGGAADASGEFAPAHIRKSAWIALGASFGLAVASISAQGAATVYGELPTIWMARWIGVVCLAILLAKSGRAPRLPIRWLPLLAFQALLDTTAYVALVLPAGKPGAEIAVVVASGFGAVTVLLARFVLKERMTRAQWAAIAVIVGGVATLSYNA